MSDEIQLLLDVANEYGQVNVTVDEIKQIRADERNKVIAEIRVGLGKVQEYEYENEDTYVNFKYYKADKVLGLLSKCAETCNKQN